MTDTPTPLSIDTTALRELLDRCEREQRHPHDHEIDAVIDQTSMTRLAAELNDNEASHADAWWRMVFVPMGMIDDDVRENVMKLHGGKITPEEFLMTLDDDQINIFTRSFSTLNDRFTRRMHRAWLTTSTR